MAFSTKTSSLPSLPLLTRSELLPILEVIIQLYNPAFFQQEVQATRFCGEHAQPNTLLFTQCVYLLPRCLLQHSQEQDRSHGSDS